MKKMYVFVALLSTCSIASAQENKEESLKREVTIEKEFTPIVNDASKINTLPEIDNPVVTKPSIRYSDWAVPMTTGPILQILPSGNFGMQPAVNPKLAKLDNVVLLPHMGSATIEGRIEMGEKVIINIKTFMDGHRPPDRVLPSML